MIKSPFQLELWLVHKSPLSRNPITTETAALNATSNINQIEPSEDSPGHIVLYKLLRLKTCVMGQLNQ